MVENLSRSPITFLLLAATLLSLAAASVAPVPSCNSPRTALNDLPISLRETQSFDLNDFFSGYNLNFSIPTKPEFVFLRDKLTTLKQTPKNQSGLKNYHLASEGNSWGATLVTLSVFGNVTTVRWGATPANESLPVLTNEAVVTSDPSMSCYDAVWFRAEMIALVDCTKNTTFGLQNYFLYVNTSSNAVLPPVKNDLYVPFTRIWHRKIRLLTEDGYHYLIRAYFAEHVDQWDDNTYLEIMSVNNPLKPWTIRVMDRSFLFQDKLSIMDFDVYLGDIYILDYHSGVIKFDITTSQTIVIAGRYRTDSNFKKMGLYSNNMVNEFLLVLAHDHAIFEIDWTSQIKPEIITKYSVPENAWMHDLWVNEGYVVVQLTANLTDAKTNQTSAYQSTYVLTRGSRTYLNAYVAVPHPNLHAFVDLHRENSQMLVIDTEGYGLHQISTPRLSVIPENPQLKNKEFSFVVRAVSTNEYTKQSLPCTFTFKYLVVDNDSLAIWTTGRKLPDSYYANYPGQLFVPLDRYALGPNITYGVYTEDKEPPTYFLLQQNTTRIEWWNKTHNILKYTFLRQEQYDSVDETVIFLYTQDHGNFTYFSMCITVPYTDEVHCVDSGYAPHIDFRIANLTANRFHYYGGKYLHLAAIVYEELPNEVFIYDVERKASMDVRPIFFPAGFEGKIQAIELLGNYLVVILRYVKEIVFFDMIQCYDNQDKECQELYRIDSRTMTRIGVNYFSPIDIYTSDFHPNVLFVQCLDRVLILDITKTGPIKLAEIKSPATQEPGFYKWKMGIARGELVLANPPNIIEEHDLDELYLLRDAPMTKVFPTYGYVIPDKFDMDCSDTGNLIYIQALDPKLPNTTNSVILVYKTGLPAVSAFYDVFHLNQRHEELLIDVSGSFGDYVAVAFNSILMMYRQYEIPILVFEDTFTDFTFNLTYTNDPQARYYYSNQATVKIANYPEDIYINDTRFNSGYLSSYLSEKVSNGDGGNSKYVPLDDEPWFNGSVLNYTLLNANDKLKVINHVNQERVLLGVLDMEDYAFSFDGGFIQQFQSIIKMRHNGSIEQFVTLPSVLDGESCISIEHQWIYDYTLSACKNGNEVYLYTTVYSASKPFVNGPYYSSAQHVTSMHVMDELMVVVDVNERPWTFDREGGVLIYAMNHDPFEPEIFDELEYINTDDLAAALHWTGGPCFIGNAHFAFTNITNTYRLVITELRNGFFVVDFRWTRGRKSVEILKVEFIDMIEEMSRIHVPLPNAAFFTAITINKDTYEANFSYWRTQVIVATSNFHTFQVDMHIDRTGTVVSHEISKIYYRYGFYETQNYIKSFDGYFAIGQKLPVMLEPFDWYSKTVLTVYDSYDHWTFNETTGEKQPPAVQYYANTTIPVQFMLGGYTFPKGRISFDWNFTFTRNSSDPIRGLSLLALHNNEARIRELSVNERLIIAKSDGLDQNIDVVLRARNDYHQLDIPFKLKVVDDTLPGWAIALIAIGSVAVAAAVGYGVFLKFVKGKRPNRESEITEKSLLEHEGEAEGDKDSDSDDQQDEQEEEEDGEQEEEQGYQPPKVEGSVDPTVTSSVNRETISSVDEVEAHLAPEGDKPEEK